MRAGTSNFIIHVGRMEGGSLDLTKQYVFRTVDSINDSTQLDWLTATSLSGAKKEPTEGPKLAVILVDNQDLNEKTFKSISDAIVNDKNINHIIGVSWYAVVKIINELGDYNTFSEPVKKLLKKLFAVEANKEDKPLNNHKSAIIAFIHGVHAYALAKKTEGVPTMDKSIEERFKLVIKYVESSKRDGSAVGHIPGIWNALQGHYLNDMKSDSTIGYILSILSDDTRVDEYLNQSAATAASPFSSSSTASPTSNVSSSLGQ
jgi:hypothetical protein